MSVGEQVNRQEEITLNEISGTGLTSSSGHGRNSSWTRESGLTMVANTGCDTCSPQALKRCLPSECQVSGVFPVCVHAYLKRTSRLSQCESIPLANVWITFLHGDNSCLLWGLPQDANQARLKFTFIWPDWINSYQEPSRALLIWVIFIY